MLDLMLSRNQQSMRILSSDDEHGRIYSLNDLQHDHCLGRQFEICEECHETQRV